MEYTYNDSGIRVSSKVNGVETRYLLDEGAVANVWEEYSPTGQVQVSYEYGNDLISQTQGGQSSFYLVDGLGSTRLLTDAQGAVLNTSGYDAFGQSTGTTGSTQNKYLFAGEQYDAGLGDYYLRQRFYDTSSGRFTRQDSYKGDPENPLSINKYIYANANPAKYIDPTGYFSLSELNVTLALISGLAALYPAGLIGAASIKQGLPDAIGFGSFLSGGIKLEAGPLEAEPITGLEIALNPKKKEAEVTWWGGIETLYEEGIGIHSLLGVGFTSLTYGVYEAAYWDQGREHTLLDNFSVAGFTAPNGTFYGGSVLPGTSEKELLIGYGSSKGSLDVFHLSTRSIAQRSFPLSQGVMASAAALLNAAFTYNYGQQFGINNASGKIGSLAGALISAGLFTTWVNLTYGKSE